MKKVSWILCAVLIFSIFLPALSFAQPTPPLPPAPPSAPEKPLPPQKPEPPERAVQKPHAPGQVLIKLKQEPDEAFLKAHQLKSATKVSKNGVLENLYLAKTETNANLADTLNGLSRDPKVDYAQLNYQVKAIAVPNDPDYSKLWGMENTGQTGGMSDADIDASSAWDTQKTTNIVVGIIDTGIDYNHEDLANNIWTNPGETPGNNIDDDNNGYIDDIHGWDFINNDNDPTDDYGHGTHVAGTIAGEGNNGKGVVGVNWSGKVASLKFLGGDGYGYTDGAVQAVLYANKMGFKITNNSWGGGGYSQALYDAIAAANSSGNLFVAAAGNNSTNMDSSPEYPAGYNLPNVISVAATDSSDGIAGFSNYGLATVDLGAPGVGIYSSVPKISCALCDPSGYMLLSGTSMASPHVAGAAALLWAKYPNLSNLDIKNKLMGTADKVQSLSGKTVTGGRLNLANAFENDNTPPSGINNLSVSQTFHNGVALSFKAVGDDGNSGTSSKYEIKYSTANITASNFDQAASFSNNVIPQPSGSNENIKVTGLNFNTKYYFAVKALDNVGNKSPISNVVSATTINPVTIFSDNFENGQGDWLVVAPSGGGNPNLWHITTRKSSSPTHAFYYGKDDTGNYDTGAANKGEIISPQIDLTKSSGSQLFFKSFLDKESGGYFDVTNVDVSSDGGTNWFKLTATQITNGNWTDEVYDLTQYDGKKIKIRFSFDTIDSVLNNFEGWFIDDVKVLGSGVAAPTPPPIPSPPGSPSPSPSSSPSPTSTPTPTPSPGPITLFSDSFEIGEWNKLWTEDSQNDWERENQRKVGTGKYSAEIDGKAIDAQLISIPIDLKGKKNVTINFSWFIENGLDLGEYLAFDISTDNGVTWQEKGKLRGNVDPENSWQNFKLDLVSINSLRIRFRGMVSDSSEDANVDAVIITGS